MPASSPRRKRLAVATCAFVVVSALVAAEACLAPTQVTLVVDTNVPCSDLRGVAITVSDRPEGAESKGFITAETGDCQAGGRVGTLVLTPSDSGRAAVVVVAGVTRPARECTAANQYEGCIVARRLVSFIDHTSLVVPVRLDVDCLNVPCNAISTCASGKCVSSETSCDGSDCSKFGVATDGGSVVVEDAPTSNDATAVEDRTAPPADSSTSEDAQPSDAAPDALSCSTDTRVPCNGGRCQAGQSCCQNTISLAEYCSTTCNGGERTFHCRSSAECESGMICCMAPSYSYTQCASACGSGGDGGFPFSFQICSASCPSCRSGTCNAKSGYSSCE